MPDDMEERMALNVLPHIQEPNFIKDVFIVNLKAFADNRGRFLEMFRQEWFPQRCWEVVQINRSDSKVGVLRGLHYHHKQVDYWYVSQGNIRAGLVDLRPASPTYLAQQMIEMGAGHEIGLFIPVGVAHGFFALTDAVVTYVVDNYYDGADEFGLAWNDPTLNLAWGIDGIHAPILSGRDAQNPLLQDIAGEDLPK